MDYIALSERYSVIAVEDVPALGGSRGEDEARRFITLVDVLYEKGVLLLLRTDFAPHDLFQWSVGSDDHDHYDILQMPSSESMPSTSTGSTYSSEFNELADENWSGSPVGRLLAVEGLVGEDDGGASWYDGGASWYDGGASGEDGPDRVLGEDLLVLDQGGSSGRSVTMFRSPVGDGRGAESVLVEWSGTGLKDASLARASSSSSLDSFTKRASSRTVSRLLQMTGETWLRRWRAVHRPEGLGQGQGALYGSRELGLFD